MSQKGHMKKNHSPECSNEQRIECLRVIWNAQFHTFKRQNHWFLPFSAENEKKREKSYDQVHSREKWRVLRWPREINQKREKQSVKKYHIPRPDHLPMLRCTALTRTLSQTDLCADEDGAFSRPIYVAFYGCAPSPHTASMLAGCGFSWDFPGVFRRSRQKERKSEGNVGHCWVDGSFCYLGVSDAPQTMHFGGGGEEIGGEWRVRKDNIIEKSDMHRASKYSFFFGSVNSTYSTNTCKKSKGLTRMSFPEVTTRSVVIIVYVFWL